MQEEPAPPYRFAALKLIPEAVGGDPIKAVKIESAPAVAFQQVAPVAAPTASAATAWVNHLFSSDDRFVGLNSQICWPYSGAVMKWNFSTHEVVTTIQGQTRYTQLQNSTIRCIDECTDQAILSFNLPLPTEEQVEWYATQTQTLESFRKRLGEVVSEKNFLEQYVQAFQRHLQGQLQEDARGAHQMEILIPFTHRDRQGRMWNATWEERCCLSDQGGFCHAARKVRLWSPLCSRAWQVAAHFLRLERADMTRVAALQAPQEVPYAVPIVASPSESRIVSQISAESSHHPVVLPQHPEVRYSQLTDQPTDDSDISEVFFDFDDLLTTGGRMVKRQAIASHCAELSAQRGSQSHTPTLLPTAMKYPVCLGPQGSQSHTPILLPVGLPDDSNLPMEAFDFDDLFQPQALLPQVATVTVAPTEFKSSYRALDERDSDGAAVGVQLSASASFQPLHSHGAIQEQRLQQNGWWVDSVGGLRAPVHDHWCYASDGTISGDGSLCSIQQQQHSSSLTTIAVHNSTPNADGNHHAYELYNSVPNADGNQAYRNFTNGNHFCSYAANTDRADLSGSVANFGIGSGAGVEKSHTEVSTQVAGVYDSIRLGVWENVWYGVFILIQLHFWYGMQANYLNRVTAQPQEQIPTLWLGNSLRNSTLEFEYQAPPFMPAALTDVLWHYQQPLLFKLLLCCLCLLASAYVKQFDCYFPQVYLTASDGEDSQQKQSQSCAVSEAQRLKRLQEISVLVLRTTAWAFVMFESTNQLLKFDFEGTTFGMLLSVHSLSLSL